MCIGQETNNKITSIYSWNKFDRVEINYENSLIHYSDSYLCVSKFKRIATQNIGFNYKLINNKIKKVKPVLKTLAIVNKLGENVK